MKQIFDAIKSLEDHRNFKSTLYTDVVEELEYDFYNDEDDFSDEGTNPPIMVNSTRSSIPAVVSFNPYSKLLSGYTNENCEINVNTKYTSVCTL